jgi:hypothetical protein
VFILRSVVVRILASSTSVVKQISFLIVYELLQGEAGCVIELLDQKNRGFVV